MDKFQGTNGIGLDIDPEKIRIATEFLKDENHIAVCQDILKLSDYKKLRNYFRFTTAIHFLEHLSSVSDTQHVLMNAIQISKEFIFILQPNYDNDVNLFKKGLKTFYSDWVSHKNLLTSYDFFKILKPWKTDGTIKDFIIFALKPIKTSSDKNILPIHTPREQHFYNKEKHPEKDMNIKLNKVYENIGVFIILDNSIPIDRYYNNVIGEKEIIYDSRKYRY